MLKVYLETTVFNRFFDERREYIDETRAFFARIKNASADAYTSTYVIEELDKASEPKRTNMLDLISVYGIKTLDIDQRAIDMANTYIEMGIIPLKFRMDGVHIAMAAINNMDCIVSLNFHHINKLKTKIATEAINRMKGYGFAHQWRFLIMTNYDDELDAIRIQFYEETKNMDAATLVSAVNSHARQIAKEFGFTVFKLPGDAVLPVEAPKEFAPRQW